MKESGDFFAVNKDFFTLPTGTATTMAHEMGHNFGFEHDDEIGPCECDDPTGKCIMDSLTGLVHSFPPSLPKFFASLSML